MDKKKIEKGLPFTETEEREILKIIKLVKEK